MGRHAPVCFRFLERCLQLGSVVLEFLDLLLLHAGSPDLRCVLVQARQQFVLTLLELVFDEKAVKELKEDLRLLVVPARQTAGLVLA